MIPAEQIVDTDTKVKFFEKLSFGLCVLAGACGGAAISRLICELSLVDVIHYDLYFKPDFPAFVLPAAAAAGAVAGGVCAKKYPDILPVFLLLLPGLLFFSNSFAFVLLAVVTAAAAGFQIGRLYPVPEKIFQRRWSILLIALFVIYSFGTGFLYQQKAFYALHFQYHDWAEYAESYLRAPLRMASCGHWNILPTLIGRFFIRLFPAPETLFVLNAFAVALGVPLAAYLAKVSNLKWRGAVCFAFIATFLPVFTHQNLCSFYGYHPVVYLILLGLLFYSFENRNNKWGMFLCAVLMLFVQETSAMLWAGWGAYKMAGEKKYLKGLCFFLAGIVLFWLFAKFSGDPSNYGQAGRYQHLGNTFTEICLSPFLKPASFFGVLTEVHTVYFALVLMIPLFFAVLVRYSAVLTVAPVFAGVLLQNYSSSKTVASQYGLEIAVCLLGLAVTSTGLVRQRKIKLPAWLDISPARYTSAILCALLFSVAAAHFFWGHSLWAGKWSFYGSDAQAGERIIRRTGNQPDMDAVFTQLCRMISPKDRLLASGRIRSRFVFRNRTFSVYTPRLPGDVIVIDLDDVMPTAKLREDLYFSSNVHLVNFINYRGIRLLVYRVSPLGVAKIPLPFLRKADQVIGNSGAKIVENEHFDIRLTGIRRNAFLTAKIKKTPEKDAEFIIRLTGKTETVLSIRFAHGALPASSARPGDVFLFQLPAGEFKDIRVWINNVL